MCSWEVVGVVCILVGFVFWFLEVFGLGLEGWRVGFVDFECVLVVWLLCGGDVLDFGVGVLRFWKSRVKD